MSIVVEFAFLAVVAWLTYFFGKKTYALLEEYGDIIDMKSLGALIVTIVFGAILIFGGLIYCLNMGSIIGLYMNGEQTKAEYQHKYDSFVYQLENNVYAQDGKFVETNSDSLYKLFNDVRYWNETITTRQLQSHHWYYGIEYPNIYDDFETIDLNNYNYLYSNVSDEFDEIIENIIERNQNIPYKATPSPYDKPVATLL